MKKYLLLVFTILLFSCGDDGQDGDAYISFDWVYAPSWFIDDCPATPSTIYKNRNYKVNEGSYSMQYEAWDGSVWSFTYSITINKGTKGSFPFQDGDNGEDKYFEINLWSTGPTIYSSIATINHEKSLMKDNTIVRSEGYIMQKVIDQNEYDYILVNTEEKVIGNSRILMNIYKLAYSHNRSLKGYKDKKR